MSSSETELLFWRVAVNNFVRIVLLKCWWRDSQSSSGDGVHVFMSLIIEAADVKITPSFTRASVWVVKKKMHVCAVH